MTGSPLKLTAALAAGAVLLAFLALPAASQVKPAEEKYKLEELAGDYVFETEGEILIIRFFADQNKLFGSPPDETPEELNPVKDQPLCFDVVTAEDGQYYFLKFVRILD